MSDLASAYAMIMMRLDERAELGEVEYFEQFYGVDLDQLADFFARCIGDDFTLKSAFEAFYIAYELGRNQEKIASTPLLD